jgi:hypothetical protein
MRAAGNNQRRLSEAVRAAVLGTADHQRRGGLPPQPAWPGAASGPSLDPHEQGRGAADQVGSGLPTSQRDGGGSALRCVGGPPASWRSTSTTSGAGARHRGLPRRRRSSRRGSGHRRP